MNAAQINELLELWEKLGNLDIYGRLGRSDSTGNPIHFGEVPECSLELQSQIRILSGLTVEALHTLVEARNAHAAGIQKICEEERRLSTMPPYRTSCGDGMLEGLRFALAALGEGPSPPAEKEQE